MRPSRLAMLPAFGALLLAGCGTGETAGTEETEARDPQDTIAPAPQQTQVPGEDEPGPNENP